MAGCKAIRTDGEPCQATAGADSDYCFWHNPARRQDLLEATRRGGQNRRRKVELPEAEPLSAEGARAILAGVVEAVIVGALDGGTARAVGYLIQIEARLREGHEMEKRIAVLEEAEQLRRAAA